MFCMLIGIPSMCFSQNGHWLAKIWTLKVLICPRWMYNQNFILNCSMYICKPWLFLWSIPWSPKSCKPPGGIQWEKYQPSSEGVCAVTCWCCTGSKADIWTSETRRRESCYYRWEVAALLCFILSGWSGVKWYMRLRVSLWCQDRGFLVYNAM